MILVSFYSDNNRLLADYITMQQKHSFHIPVMGIAFTLDSPIKVARYGIDSVLSIVEDRIIETMRSYYYPFINKEYIPISDAVKDYRAKRIQDYLNLVNTIVKDQIDKIKLSAFEKGSEIVKYFEMLPNDHPAKELFYCMMKMDDPREKARIEALLREQVTPGSIDVNIMTKVDKDNMNKQGEVLEDHSDAVAALRGYANADLDHSAIVFSAGLNPRLYNYLEKCESFDIDKNGHFKKRIIIKVSDYRSALIQGKYLAKKGFWVSEFRIESGLNCGGHAFATDGFLMGPILEEFKLKKEKLKTSLFELYHKYNAEHNKTTYNDCPEIRITAQGGIGTHEEDQLLKTYYEINSTGWGTPFLLVPEATTVDEHTLQLLSKATKNDLVLSNNSPLGVRFHYLKGTSSDIEKQMRIDKGNPGSPCPEKHLALNTEFAGEPLCTASQKYQKLKIAQLGEMELEENEREIQLNKILEKECLCIGLSNAAAHEYNAPFLKKYNAVTICPGPNIANFSKIVSLSTMVDHIYGRTDIMTNTARPHMFINELQLYIEYLVEQILASKDLDAEVKKKKQLNDYYLNLKTGIAYYRALPEHLGIKTEAFLKELSVAENEIDKLKEIYL